MHCAYNDKVVLHWMSFTWKKSYHLLGGGAFDSAGNMYGRSEWSVISVYGLSFQFTVCHFSLWSVIMEGALEKLY